MQTPARSLSILLAFIVAGTLAHSDQGMETVTTTWMWKGLLMKSVSNAMGTEITEHVTSIDEGIGVRADLRRIPDDVQITTPAK